MFSFGAIGESKVINNLLIIVVLIITYKYS
jgi:hypothetical protein